MSRRGIELALSQINARPERAGSPLQIRYEDDEGSGEKAVEAIEFFVDGDEAVNATYEDLTGAGYAGRRAPFRTTFGAWMAMVDDPDGNVVLITAG